MRFGWANADEVGDGSLMGIDLYPRIDADGQTLELEISPSGVSTNTPIHPALRATGPGGDLEKKGGSQ